MLMSDLVVILRDLCSCNLTSSDLSNTSMQCNAMKAFITATLTYSTDTGDEIATTIAQKLSAEALVSSSGLKIGNDILIETVRFSNDAIQSTESNNSGQISTIAGVAVGSFIGGAILVVICIGIVLTLYCVR